MVEPTALAFYNEMPYTAKQQSYRHGQGGLENSIASEIDT